MRRSPEEVIVADFNNGKLTLEEGVAAFIEIFSNQNTLSFFCFIEEVTDSVAIAIVQALNSRKSRINHLVFAFGDRITPQDQYIINKSKIPKLSFEAREGACKDLVTLILNNPHLKSLEIEDPEFSEAAYLEIMEAVSQSNIKDLVIYTSDYNNLPLENKVIAHCLRKSKIETLELDLANDAMWPVLAVHLPSTRITSLKIPSHQVFFDGAIEAYRKLRTLRIYSIDEGDKDVLNVLPLLNINYLELEVTNEMPDAELASSLKRSSVLVLNCINDLPLSEAAVQENRRRVGHKVAFFLFQWLLPQAAEKNGFNSLPRDAFYLLLRHILQPTELGQAYCNKVEANVRKLLVDRRFYLVENRLKFFGMNDEQHMIQQQEQALNQLRKENTVLQRRNTLLSANLGELKQTLFSLMPVLPEEALEKLKSTQVFAADPEALREEEAQTAEPEVKKHKFGN